MTTSTDDKHGEDELKRWNTIDDRRRLKQILTIDEDELNMQNITEHYDRDYDNDDHD